MRIFALELNNDIKGIEARKQYIESLIAKLPAPDLVLLPELALASYMPNQAIWQYADHLGKETSAWAIKLCEKFNIFIGVGYVDREKGHYYNRYLLTNKNKVFGVVTKSEAEAAVFKRGKFNNIIKTPFGNIAVAICYDARRKHFYENIKDETISLIVFPHGSAANAKRDLRETKANDYLCNLYHDAFQVPVIYINSIGKLAHMPGIMGNLMKKNKFTLNGKTKIYTREGKKITHPLKAVIGYDLSLTAHKRTKDILFHGNNLTKENTFFRHFILRPDIFFAIKRYNKNIKKK